MVPHLAALQFFPLIVLLASSNLDRWRSVLALTALATLQGLTDLVYIAPAVLGPLGILALFRLARRRTRRSGLRVAGVVVASAALLSPVAYG